MKKFTHLLILHCLFALPACWPSGHSKMPKEELMERLLHEKPDSLALLLEEKVNPCTLSDRDKADYALWLTKTHMMQNRSLINDTLIHCAVEFYRQTASPHLLDACLLAARQINRSGTALSQQKQLLNETLLIAMQQKDTTMVQEICSRLTQLYEIPGDSEKIKKLIRITERYAGPNRSITSYRNLAAQYRKLNRLDSVFPHIRKGIDLARKQNSPIEFDLTRTYITLLNASGNSKEALSVLRDLEHRVPAGKNDLRIHYIHTWINMGKLDSARVYINSCQSFLNEVKNQEGGVGEGTGIEIEIINSILEFYKEVIRAKEGKPLLMNEVGVSINSFMDKTRNRMKIDREQQFVQNKLIRDNLMLDIKHGKLKQCFLWTVIVVLLVIIILISIYYQKLLQKERSVRQAEEQLRMNMIQMTENESVIRKNEELINSLSSQLDESGELKQEIAQLNEEKEALKEKNRTLKKEMERYAKETGQKDSGFNVFEKLAEENAKLQERERFLTAQLIARTEILNRLSKRPRYIEKSYRDEIVHAVNQLFDGYSHRLHNHFPALTEEDIFYCCLFKLRLSTSAIGTLLGISPSSVTKRKQRVKEKMIQQYPDENRSEKQLEIYSWN